MGERDLIPAARRSSRAVRNTDSDEALGLNGS
jgi:hypothetical protein